MYLKYFIIIQCFLQLPRTPFLLRFRSSSAQDSGVATTGEAATKRGDAQQQAQPGIQRQSICRSLFKGETREICRKNPRGPEGPEPQRNPCHRRHCPHLSGREAHGRTLRSLVPRRELQLPACPGTRGAAVPGGRAEAAATGRNTAEAGESRPAAHGRKEKRNQEESFRNLTALFETNASLRHSRQSVPGMT